MVDVSAPIRSEPLFDAETGNITVRFATFLDSLSSMVNEITIITEVVEEAAAQTRKTQALIAELQKQVNNLEELVE